MKRPNSFPVASAFVEVRFKKNILNTMSYTGNL